MAGSFGALSAGWLIEALQTRAGWSDIASYRSIFAMYAVWGTFKGCLTLMLSERCEAIPKAKQKVSLRDGEADETVPILRDGGITTGGATGESSAGTREQDRSEQKRVLGLSRETQSKVRTLSLLFGLDNLASGLVPL